jgi:putative membrane protein
MNRTTTTLLSLGVSAVLIAVGVWFIYNHSIGIWPENSRWAIGHHGMMGGSMGFVMIIFWIVLIGAFALLVSGAVNGFRGSKSNGKDAPNALEILQQRYARGEIDKEEYEAKRLDLNI